VLVGGERVLRAPSVESLAEALGLRTTAASDYYHVVICGGGPAGLAAAVYAASEGLRTLLIDRGTPGGQASQSSLIENYLGFPSGISGAELTRNALAQAKRFGSEVLSPCAASEVRAAGEYRRVVVGDREIATHAVVVATGVAWRTLDAPGLAALTGAGVYYGASRSEDEALRGEEVWIVGGANSAGQAALHFAGIAARVHMVIRATSLRDGMSTYLAERLEGIPNVVVHPEREVARAHGTDRLEGLTLRHVGRGNEEEVPVRSLFVFIGAEPDTAWLGDAYARDPHGFLLTGPEAAASGLWREKRPPATLETSVAGVFAAGDVRAHANRRVASAVGDGGMAVSLVHRHLRHLGAHP
jgi:thioredoxin reductase (NADPH)